MRRKIVFLNPLTDRARHVGGVAIYIKSNIKTKCICKSPKDSEIEYMFIELFNSDDKILIAAIYRPSRLIDILPITTIISQISLIYSNVVISGDFDCHILSNNSLSNEMSSLGLYSCNYHVPTHFTKNCCTLLDLFFVSDLTKR